MSIFTPSILKRLLRKKARSESKSKPFHANTTREDRRDWFAHTPPWDRIAPIVIDAILDGIADKALLEAFVLTSGQKRLVGRYEPLGGEGSDATVIRAQISQILCQFGHRELASLAKAMEAKQMDAAAKIAFSTVNAFEAAIALAKNQVAAFIGMAAFYEMVGKSAESRDYAKQGLLELEEMRRDGTAKALAESTLFPRDILDQAEQQLCSLAGFTDDTSHQPAANFRAAGRTMAMALLDPDDCWREVCKLREYKAPGAVATCEMAFARAAVIRDAIRRCQPNPIAAEFLAGVDNFVADAFANEDTAETLEFYDHEPLSAVAPQAIRHYEENLFPLTQLADLLARRLSVPGWTAMEIAPLFEEVAAEAERLMKISSLLQKLGR